MNFITLGNRIISPKSRPYVIAEIGVNHEGSLDLAKRLIELAKEGVPMPQNSKPTKPIHWP